MIQSTLQVIAIDEFITHYGDDYRYELIDGDLIDMESTSPHEQVAEYISRN